MKRADVTGCPERSNLLKRALLILLTGAWVACAPTAPEERTTTGEIGTEGGTVALKEAASVKIPAGALSARTEITVRVVTPSGRFPFQAASALIEIGPAGLKLERPARVTLVLDRDTHQEELQVVRVANLAATTHEPVGGTAVSNGEASFETTETGLFVVASGLTCTPEAASNNWFSAWKR
jgi:hypothetical protein